MASRDPALGAPTLNDLTVALTGAGTVDDVATVVLGLGAAVVDAHSAHLSVVVQPGWRRDFSRRSPNAPITGGSLDRPIALDTPLSRALVLQRPQVFESRAEYRANFPHLARELDQIAANTAITLPMRRSDGLVIGALTLAFAEAGPLPPARASLATQVTEQCSLALERALLLHREREAARRALRLQATATRLAGVAHTQDLAVVLSSACRESLDATSCVVYELEADGELVLLDPTGEHDDRLMPRRVALGQANPVREATLLGGVIAIENSAQFELRYDGTNWPMARALLALPLRVGAETLGALYATFDSARRFPPDERSLAATLAEQVSLALERCRLHERAEMQTKIAERERDRLMAITAALQDGLFATDVDGRIIDVNDRFCEITGYEREHIIGTMPPYPWWPRSDPETISRFLSAIRERILGSPSDATNEFDVTLQRPDGRRTLGLLTAAPLHDTKGEVTGVVGTLKDVSARVLAERRLRVLQAITAELAAAATVADVAEATVDESVHGLRAAAGAFFLARDDGPVHLLHAYEVGSGAASTWRADGVISDPNAMQALKNAEISTVGPSSPLDESAALPPGIVRSVAIPVFLRDDENAVACISLMFREDRPVIDEDLSLYTAISQQCGQALLRAFATEAEHLARVSAERSSERMRRLQQVTAALTVATEPADVARAVTGQITSLFGAAGVALFAVDDEAANLVLIDVDQLAGGHEIASRVTKVPLDAGLSLTDAVLEKQAIWIQDVDDWKARYPKGWEAYGSSYSALVNLPLVVDDVSLGVLGLVFEDPLDVSDDDRAVLLTLANLAAHALHRASRFAVEQNVAATLQESLLPRVVESTDRCRIAVRYQPSVDELHVGGDWFDTFKIREDMLAVTVGDVVGRGLSAAACMGQLRSAIGVLALGGSEPADLLDQIDRFAERVEGGEAATVAFAALDLVSGRLRHACAGHPPPLLITPEGKAEFLLEGRSWPVGIGHHGRRSDATTRLRPGSTVVFYTDGLVERRRISLDERLGVLAAAAQAGPVHDPELLTDHLLDAMLDESLRDDVAVLTMRYDPALAETVHWQFPAEPISVQDVRGVMRRWLHRRGVDGHTAFDIVVACDEACANAVEHGSPSASANIDLTMSIDDAGSIVVSVADEGGWHPSTREDEPGYGLALMEALMSSVSVESGDDGTVVRLERR